MFIIQVIQKCTPGCSAYQSVIDDFRGVLGFGTLGEGGELFVTDGDKRACLNRTCAFCGEIITYVAYVKQEGDK